MLRLCAEADAQDLPSVYHPINPITANTLHRVGEKLSYSVRATRSPHIIHRIHGVLFSQLFGEDEDSGGELDEAEKQGENGK